MNLHKGQPQLHLLKTWSRFRENFWMGSGNLNKSKPVFNVFLYPEFQLGMTSKTGNIWCTYFLKFVLLNKFWYFRSYMLFVFSKYTLYTEMVPHHSAWLYTGIDTGSVVFDLKYRDNAWNQRFSKPIVFFFVFICNILAPILHKYIKIQHKYFY